MANIPNYNSSNIDIGPGILFVGPSGTTPTIDVGAISEDGMEFTVKRDFLDVHQGSPKQLIKRFVTDEEVELAVQTLEWNLMNLPRALGTGVTTSTASVDTFSFGADPGTAEVAVQVDHTLPSGQTVSFFLWRCQPIGEWKTSLKESTLLKFPFGFKVLQSTLAWDNSALASGQQLFRIKRQKL